MVGEQRFVYILFNVVPPAVICHGAGNKREESESLTNINPEGDIWEERNRKRQKNKHAHHFDFVEAAVSTDTLCDVNWLLKKVLVILLQCGELHVLGVIRKYPFFPEGKIPSLYLRLTDKKFVGEKSFGAGLQVDSKHVTMPFLALTKMPTA